MSVGLFYERPNAIFPRLRQLTVTRPAHARGKAGGDGISGIAGTRKYDSLGTSRSDVSVLLD
jgi:hypothetical protein